jgi:hypothetical protein
MSDHDPMDQRLSALFSRLDTRLEFNARLLDRLHQEVTQDARERARQARELEQLRHGVVRRELLGWRGWTRAVSRIVTLETVGLGVLAVSVIASAWSSEQIRQFAPVLVTAVGVLLALAPVIAPAVLKHK